MGYDRKLLNYTQLGRKKQIDTTVSIIAELGGVAGLNRLKKDGSYPEFISYLAYQLGSSRKLAQEYIRIAIDAARFKSIELEGKTILIEDETI